MPTFPAQHEHDRYINPIVKSGVVVVCLIAFMSFNFMFMGFKAVIDVINVRRSRRVRKSPDPLEEQRRKELQQGEIGTGGLFGCE